MTGEGKGFWASVGSGLISGVAATAVVAGGAFVFEDWIADRVAELRPTCDQPTGLIQVDPERLTAEGDYSAVRHPNMYDGPGNAIDGYLGSFWLPSLAEESPKKHRAVFAEKAQLELHISEGEPDVELLCVNNGLAYSEKPYRNFGRVRTVHTWAADHEDQVTTTTLSSLPSNRMTELQEVGRDLGETNKVVIEVDDAYAGDTVESFDPDACGKPSQYGPKSDGERPQLRYERGCINAAAPWAGLSEVVVYVEAED